MHFHAKLLPTLTVSTFLAVHVSGVTFEGPGNGIIDGQWLAGAAIPPLDIPGIDEDDIVVRADPHNNRRFNYSVFSTGVPLGNINCETSGASPTLTEIDSCIEEVYKRHDCKQDNIGGSKCRLIASHFGGDISVCGKYGKNIKCSEVAKAAQQLKFFCSAYLPGHAGGFFTHYGEYQGLRTVVH